MSAFRFRLDPIRRLRQSHRDELRGQLSAAFQAADVLSQQQAQVRDELNQLRASQRSATAATNLDVTSLLDSQRYEFVLQGQQKALGEKLKLVEQEIERRRQALAEAERGVRTLDKLEDRQLEAHRLEVGRSEAKLMDETAAVGATRRGLTGDDQS